MMVDICYNSARRPFGQGAPLDALAPANTGDVRAFHRTFREYAPTPLHDLPHLAGEFGLGRILIKDESRRFGLNAFKVLGASYAIGRYLAEKLGRPLSSLDPDRLRDPVLREKLGDITFATTTDGNHGRGVAWTARQMGQKAVVYMPRGSASSRVENIRALGAECSVTDLNYDDAVRMTWARARERGWVMVQDTAWDGYEEIPAWIMQGYTTLAAEALEQMRTAGTQAPTHVFLQAGVGSFAGAVLGCLAAELGPDMPVFVIVEPHRANCIYRSVLAADGRPHSVAGDLDTLMAGLACGEPNTISWPLLRDYAAACVSCPDCVAADGMRILAAPRGGDVPVLSGESGAVTTGVLQWIMQSEEGAEAREKLRLNGTSTVLLISTEGDTSPSTYRDVVWFGRHSRWSE